MIDANLIWAAAAIGIVATIAAAALNGWRGWLELRRLELAVHKPELDPTPATRIEMADMRERLRKLEAIAAGLDL